MSLTISGADLYLFLAEYFGKLTNTRIRLNSFIANARENIMNMIISNISMVLQTIPSPRFQLMFENNLDDFVKMSPYVEFTDTSKVLAHSRKGMYFF